MTSVHTAVILDECQFDSLLNSQTWYNIVLPDSRARGEPIFQKVPSWQQVSPSFHGKIRLRSNPDYCLAAPKPPNLRLLVEQYLFEGKKYGDAERLAKDKMRGFKVEVVLKYCDDDAISSKDSEQVWIVNPIYSERIIYKARVDAIEDNPTWEITADNHISQDEWNERLPLGKGTGLVRSDSEEVEYCLAVDVSGVRHGAVDCKGYVRPPVRSFGLPPPRDGPLKMVLQPCYKNAGLLIVGGGLTMDDTPKDFNQRWEFDKYRIKSAMQPWWNKKKVDCSYYSTSFPDYCISSLSTKSGGATNGGGIVLEQCAQEYSNLYQQFEIEF